MTHDTDRQKIRAAFRSLRQQGWVARMSFQCCQGCALNALNNESITQPYVFFHRQEAEAFQVYRGRGKATDTLQRPLFLYWGNRRTPVPIIKTLRAHGLNVSWRGRQSDAVQVHD